MTEEQKEKPELIKKISKAEPIISIEETEEEKKLDDRTLKKSSKKYAQDNFQGKKYLNTDTGENILVSRDGIDKWEGKTKSREQAISIKKLDELLEKSKKAKSLPDKKGRENIEGYNYYNSPIDVNKKPYNANIAARKGEGDKLRYYYHFLKDREEKKEPS